MLLHAMNATSIPATFSDPLAIQANGAAAAAPARSAQRAGGGGEAAAGVPFSNTGRKIGDNQPLQGHESAAAPLQGFELDGEWVQLLAKGGKPILLRKPIPYASGIANAALIDWMAFTVRPPENETHQWVIQELQWLELVGVVNDMTGGYAGYTHKAQATDGKTRRCLIAWGGKNQASTVYVSFTGQGCARITDWGRMRAWLEEHRATLTRLDLAYDDFQAERVSIGQAVEWYQSGGFGAGGRMPSHRLHGDWLLGDKSQTGRTLEIGSRQGGKLCRVYEKGKQLGDPANPWVRVEVEWHRESREIPYEALTEPGRYLAGAYECLHFLDQEQSRIRTEQRSAKVSFDKAMNNGRHSTGKLINLALEVYEGDYGEVVEQLRREGYPARVEPYMHSVKDAPEILAAVSTVSVGATSMPSPTTD